MSQLSSAWWSRSVYADKRPFLLLRARIIKEIRLYFEALDCLEVETASLQRSPGNETHLHAFSTQIIRPDASVQRAYLHTSPEFACKKLLSAGEEHFFTLAKVYRNRERGALHQPEFTMLEWYHAHTPYTRLMEECAALLALAARSSGLAVWSYQDKRMDPLLPPEHLSVMEAFARYAQLDLNESLDAPKPLQRDILARQAQHLNLRVSEDDTWSDIFSKILTYHIEPHLGVGRATVLMEYPLQEAALARPCPHDPRLAERFELYACGVELANAFGELTDAAEQKRRFEQEMAHKQRIYGETYPIDEELIAALAHMPPASGAALGIDRLVMLAVGARHLEQVMFTPVLDT